jgi:hypothetical protein
LHARTGRRRADMRTLLGSRAYYFRYASYQHERWGNRPTQLVDS